MKKVFISVGMSGRSESDVVRDINRLRAEAMNEFEGEYIEFVDNWLCERPDGAERLYCLGEAIKKLGECDACYFDEDFSKYKGCRVELAVCNAYGIPVYGIEES